jgi:YHS domain-containing protein
MATGNDLEARIDAEFTAAQERIKAFQTSKVEEYEGRHQRLEQFVAVLDRLRDIWHPRLKTLAEKFGPRVQVHPNIEPGRRSATFEFKSDLATIKLRFGVSPDDEVRNLIVTYDLDIIPILMKFDSHAEMKFPIDNVDEAAFGKWIDDRIVAFVQTYLSLNANQYYLKDHMVEDPVAKVRFPKYAAGATLDVDGRTLYFLSETTLREYQQGH